ncbi:hypothetical protein GLE_4837 [Lysobacter enzymogenes]|uniref:Uncharacterized protein n=1 Tax=Lysobacter enzymogenes TaxID=69 RepID=A0A0S2DNL6_LYSEN|nr:hypothetical protein GLE_4837 [Lysobacter enzymogenes]
MDYPHRVSFRRLDEWCEVSTQRGRRAAVPRGMIRMRAATLRRMRGRQPRLRRVPTSQL